MKLRFFISICLLAVYAIILSHNFVPHHHHSQSAKNVEHCHEDDNQHHEASIVHEEIGHDHASESHIYCSFENVIMLSKNANLSEVYLLTASNEIGFAKEDKQRVNDLYIIPQIPESHCRDIQLRGPPQFS